jgi:AraC-like DNA-binding protein
LGLSKSKLFEDTRKYENSPISEDLKKEYLMKIEKAFTKEVYVDPLITLDKLSKSIHIPKNHLSQIINESYELNFNEFINKYRIERAKRLIEQSNEGAIFIDIAYSVGFNSKSTFNKAFRKFTGMTPSNYLDHNRRSAQ